MSFGGAHGRSRRYFATAARARSSDQPPTLASVVLVEGWSGSSIGSTDGGDAESGCGQSEVVKWDAERPERLDSSNSIDVHSLRWSHGRVRWSDGDETHSAPLP